MTTKTMIMTLAVAALAVAGSWGLVWGDAVGDECANEFPKVTACLTFATGKGDTPTGECCKSVTDLKNRKPVCLCYIIQQIHDGNNPQIKSMGIQEARLLQLPSACKLANASSDECPKLLGLAPNSPDAAIFANNSTASATPGGSTATPSSPDTSSSRTTSANNSSAAHAVAAAGLTLATAALAIFSSFFSGVSW